MIQRQHVQVPRKRDVVLNHLAVTGGSCLLQGEPDLQSAKPARVLRSHVEVVCGLSFEVVIRRVKRERIPQQIRVADKCASSLEWRVQPFVRIYCDRIRQLKPCEIRW